jgi:cystathionine beta-synthase/cysteine synthase A
MQLDASFPSPYPTDDPILGLIGNTPMIPYPDSDDPALFCKLETENPTRSMKDRVALGILSEALADDAYDRVVEASSGNTAGAVALVARRLGAECHLTCPETTSPHKIGYMRAFGAQVHLCPSVGSDHPDHYRNTARRMAGEMDGAFIVDQYRNLSNPGVHRRWTGPEIWAQAGPEMTHLVCAMGTGGIMSGSARAVKEKAAAAGTDVTTVGVDATRSNISTAFYGQDPVEYDTAVEGLGKGFELPTMWFDSIDEIRDVDDERAFRVARRAAQEHGFLVGPSAGAALAVGRDIAREQPDARVVVIVCDGGEQYFETLFAPTAETAEGAAVPSPSPHAA